MAVYWYFGPKVGKKATKSALLGKKGGGLFKFWQGGGLIKSSGLYAWIWYTYSYAIPRLFSSFWALYQYNIKPWLLGFQLLARESFLDKESSQ